MFKDSNIARGYGDGEDVKIDFNPMRRTGMEVVEIQKIIQMYYPPSEVAHLCAKEIYAKLKEDGHGE